MSDIEVSDLIKKLMTDLKNAETNLEQSEDFLILQTRMEEIEAIDENEATEEIIKESEKIEAEIEEMYTNLKNAVLKDISQVQMLEILSTITPQFIEENHIPTSSWMGSGHFEKIVASLLNNLKDENHELHNRLLANDDFTEAISYSIYLLNQLVMKTNNEQIFLNFIQNYSQNFGKADVKKDEHSIGNSNTELGDLIETIINSENYSSTFKDSLLLNQELIPYISSFSLARIVKESNLSKDKKFELLLRPDVFNKMSDYHFSFALSSLCKTYDDFQKLLNDNDIFKRVNINLLLRDTKLSPTELKKIILDDKVFEKIDWLQLQKILQHGKMDFETRKSILFDDKLFPKLNALAIANILTSKYINGEQRLELLSDSRIYNALISGSNKQINTILESRDVPILDKVAIARDNRFIDQIDNRILQQVMRNPDLPIEVATDILFDKNLFYRLIGEWNEEYNHSKEFYGNKGPYKYDKYEFVKKLYEKNPYIARTLSYELLKDGILDLGFDFVEKMSRYTNVAQQLGYVYSNWGNPTYLENMIKAIENSQFSEKIDTALFVTKLLEINSDKSYYSKNPKEIRKLSKIRYTTHLDASAFTPEHWKTLTEIGLRDVSIYYNGIEIGFGTLIKDEIDISLNILPDVETIEDLDNYTERRMKLCDDIFKSAVEKRDLDGAKNAYLNKYFSINIQEAQEIARMYGFSIHEFDDNSSYAMQTKYVEQIMKILSLEKIDTISQSYNDSRLEPLSFDEIIYIDQSLRQTFSKQMSDSVYKISDRILDENGNLIQNAPQYVEFIIEKDGMKATKKVPVYEPGFDFKMLIHSTDAYGKMELINNNYFDSWNKSGRKTNHGICCSLISNDNMGMAAVNDVLFGFDSWDPKAITKSAPYDIYSVNDDYNIQEGRPLTFMTAQDIINNTRHTHNEQVLERYEIRDDKRTSERQNIQPSYVIIYSDMPDHIKQKAIKCSEEMAIPIVYLDKKKIIRHEVKKIDLKIKKLQDTPNLEDRLDILEQILLSHENNRSGLRATNNDWIEKYFPTSKVESLFDQVIIEIQSKYQKTGNIADYYKYSSQLMDILDRENQKFKVTMESTERKNYIDIPIEEYKNRIIQFVNQNLCKTSLPKLESIMQTYQSESPDLPITQALSLVDSSFIHSQVEDILSKNLYPNDGKNHNIGHIERVLFLTQLIGKNELALENGEIDSHAMDLLTQCAKYHDCGRENDTTDKKHGQKSAKKMAAMLSEDGYVDEDIKIMQVVVDYHEEVDDDFRFGKVCQKYGLDPSKMDLAKKIAYCLKDADALDRTRFKNPNARLDTQMLRTDFSKSLVPVAESLNRSYETFDKQQFEKTCQYLLYQQQLQQQEQALQEMVVNQTQDVISQGRRK